MNFNEEINLFNPSIFNQSTGINKLIILKKFKEHCQNFYLDYISKQEFFTTQKLRIIYSELQCLYRFSSAIFFEKAKILENKKGIGRWQKTIKNEIKNLVDDRGTSPFSDFKNIDRVTWLRNDFAHYMKLNKSIEIPITSLSFLCESAKGDMSENPMYKYDSFLLSDFKLKENYWLDDKKVAEEIKESWHDIINLIDIYVKLTEKIS